MKRYYYVSNDLGTLETAQQALEKADISTTQIHVLSQNDAAVAQHQLHEVAPVLKKNVVHGTEIGAIIGIVGAIIVLIFSALSGLYETYTWVPPIFLALMVLGFCAWEGGFIGIQEPHVDFRRFQVDLDMGKHIFFIDAGPQQENQVQQIVGEHQNIKQAGTGSSTPDWVINIQQKWIRFLQLAP